MLDPTQLKLLQLRFHIMIVLQVAFQPHFRLFLQLLPVPNLQNT
jgi:hypothetical protein